MDIMKIARNITYCNVYNFVRLIKILKEFCVENLLKALLVQSDFLFHKKITLSFSFIKSSVIYAFGATCPT